MISELIRSVTRTDFDSTIDELWVTGNERIIIMTNHPAPARITSDIEDNRSIHFVRVGTADIIITTNGRSVGAITMLTHDTWEVVFVEPDTSSNERRI